MVCVPGLVLHTLPAEKYFTKFLEIYFSGETRLNPLVPLQRDLTTPKEDQLQQTQQPGHAPYSVLPLQPQRACPPLG